MEQNADAGQAIVRGPEVNWSIGKNSGGRLLAFLALLAMATGVSAREEGPPAEAPFEPHFFVVMADPQLGWATRNADCDIEEKNFRRAIEAANRLRPDFVVICGDLVNAPGDAEQIGTFQRLMDEFSGDFPVYLASGNHDVTGAPTPEALKAYRETFGPDRYTFDNRGCRFLVLNSTILMNGDKVPDEVEAQFEWVRAELERARAEGIRDLFVVQHHPWFFETGDEPYRFLNNVRPETRKPYLDLFDEYGVMATFAGHTHRNVLGRHGGMEMITSASITPPSGDDPAGFRIVRVYGDSIEHEYYGFDDMPASVRVVGD